MSNLVVGIDVIDVANVVAAGAMIGLIGALILWQFSPSFCFAALRERLSAQDTGNDAFRASVAAPQTRVVPQ